MTWKTARAVVGDVGQQSDLTGPLDGLSQLTLMHGAGAGGPAGQDLGALGNKPTQLGSILIIDELALVRAELADLTALAAHGTSGSGFTIESHDWFLLYQNQNGSSPSSSPISAKSEWPPEGAGLE